MNKQYDGDYGSKVKYIYQDKYKSSGFYWNTYNKPGGNEQTHHIGILWGFIQIGFLYKKLDFINIGLFQYRPKKIEQYSSLV